MTNEVEEILNKLIETIINKCNTNKIKTSSESHVKKRRGRPRKEKVNNETKRQPGRPKKVITEQSIIQKDDRSNSSDDSSEEITLDKTLIDLYKTQNSEHSYRLTNPKIKRVNKDEEITMKRNQNHLYEQHCGGIRKKKVILVDELLHPDVSICKTDGAILNYDDFMSLQSKRSTDYMFCIQVERFEQPQVTSTKKKRKKQDISYLNIHHWEDPIRTINHSCNPNCCLVEQEGRNSHYPDEIEMHYILFPIKKINFTEELTIDYGWYATNIDELQPCECESANCTRTIHKNGKLITKNNRTYAQIDNKQPVLWPNYKHKTNESVGCFKWEFLYDLDITDIHLVKARDDYFKRYKPEDSNILVAHKKLLKECFKNENVKKFPNNKMGRPPALRFTSFVGYYSEGTDIFGCNTNGRETDSILLYVQHRSGSWHCTDMERDKNGQMFSETSRIGHVQVSY